LSVLVLTVDESAKGTGQTLPKIFNEGMTSEIRQFPDNKLDYLMALRM
jgi:hypothetical protein